MFNQSINKIVFILICLLFFESKLIKAQSAAICQGDSAVLKINCSYSGSLQWEYSSDLLTWSTISGATLDTLRVIPSNTTNYRAAITNGTCNIVYSDTAVITVYLIPPAPSIVIVDTCGISRLTASNYTGTLLWSTGQTVNPITINSAGIYTLSQTVNGCTSATVNIAATPLFAPPGPATGTNMPSATQIVWNWNTVADATGYKYNTVNDYSTATDNLGNVSYTQTGLTCNTAYTLYVWAYNSCGISAVTTLTQTTVSCCVANMGEACDKGGWTSVACDPAKCVTAKVNCAEHVTKHCYPIAPLSDNWEPAWTYSTDCTVAQYTYFNDPPCFTNVWVSDMSGVVQCDGACQ